jgi:drug/metabolite transporter (DMT)-like permease
MIWIPVTILASALQVARNAAQRSIMGAAGPWGATLVRFLFGLPFSLLFAVVVASLTGFDPHPVPKFWLAAGAGAILQIAATAAQLTSMQRSTFALGTALQQSGLPFALIFGTLLFQDHVSGLTWMGGVLASLGLMAVSWPRATMVIRPSAIVFGLLAGGSFALSANMFRQASRALDPHHLLISAIASVAVVQALQASLLTIYLLLKDRNALMAVLFAWRRSLGAGLFGAGASALWFFALALSPVGPVRAVGVVEMPFAALAGRRLFREKTTLIQWVGGSVTAIGVVIAAIGVA